MSDGKIDEAISNENGDKEDEALNNSVSDDGEIFDDDEPEENEKVPIIDLPRKNVKNFRSRQENSDSEGARSDGGTGKTQFASEKKTNFDFHSTEKSKGITDGELRKLSRMNGVQMLDKNVLENYRDKIINELEKKNDRPKERTETDRRNFDLNSRFNASRNGFRGNRGQNKRNDWRNNRASFLERNRLNRPREK